MKFVCTKQRYFQSIIHTSAFRNFVFSSSGFSTLNEKQKLVRGKAANLNISLIIQKCTMGLSICIHIIENRLHMAAPNIYKKNFGQKRVCTAKLVINIRYNRKEGEAGHVIYFNVWSHFVEWRENLQSQNFLIRLLRL